MPRRVGARRSQPLRTVALSVREPCWSGLCLRRRHRPVSGTLPDPCDACRDSRSFRNAGSRQHSHRHERTRGLRQVSALDVRDPNLLHDVHMLSSGRTKAAAVATLLLATAGCGGGSASTSSGDAERDARVVLQADLQPGSTGKTAARLAQKFIDLEGVAGTRGDSGQHVWIYSTPDATAAQLSAALAAMHAESSVVRVEKVRRSDSGM